ncbi:hypothetical protein GCM10025880_54270 [Methylorubrum aminovorans]|uniref:beta strand repeat-containing protein n=1 Tax=Methylorubrum aminovorans TaxID=269069 RepID=UPI0023E9DE5B|nr:hypothetical protein [Methylorubrum aminovorans]GMA79010.1 hypothetical protein GCM10025880_54270 [Methylorubrum aminovorans]
MIARVTAQIAQLESEGGNTRLSEAKILELYEIAIDAEARGARLADEAFRALASYETAYARYEVLRASRVNGAMTLTSVERDALRAQFGSDTTGSGLTGAAKDDYIDAQIKVVQESRADEFARLSALFSSVAKGDQGTFTAQYNLYLKLRGSLVNGVPALTSAEIANLTSTFGTDATGAVLSGTAKDSYVAAKIQATLNARGAEYTKLNAIFASTAATDFARLNAVFGSTALTAYVIDQIQQVEASRTIDYRNLAPTFGSFPGVVEGAQNSFTTQYDLYWKLRSSLVNGVLKLTNAEIADLTRTFGTDATGATLSGAAKDSYVAGKIKATLDDRATEYAKLNAVYAGFGDRYLPKLGTAYQIYSGYKASADAGGIVRITGAERIALAVQFADQAKFQTLGEMFLQAETAKKVVAAETALKAEYARLHADFGSLGDTYDASRVEARSDQDKARYDTYWSYRNQQIDPSIYNASFTPRLTGQALIDAAGAARAQAAAETRTKMSPAITSALQAAQDARGAALTAQYRALHAFFNSLPGSDGENALTAKKQDNPAFFVDRATAKGIDDSIKRWTKEELLSAVGQGLLKEVPSTVVDIQSPIIKGRSIKLVAAGSVGSTSDTTLIKVGPNAPPQTTEQQIDLAAAERSDLVFLTGEPTAADVIFANNGATGTVTWVGGKPWDLTAFIKDGNVIDATLFIGGLTQNATAETRAYFKIVSVTDTVITVAFSGSKTFQEGSARNVTFGASIAVSGEAPRASATMSIDRLKAAPASVELSFSNDAATNQGVLTLASGTWDTALYAVGDTLFIAGDTTNTTAIATNVFRIAAIAGGVIRLEAGQLFDTTGGLNGRLAANVEVGVRATGATGGVSVVNRALSDRDASFLADGFKQGMRIGLAGAFGVTTANATGAATYYEIAKAGKATLVLDTGNLDANKLAPTTETGRSLIVFQSAKDAGNPFNLVTRLLIQKRKAVVLETAGTLDVSAGGQIFITTPSSATVGLITSTNGQQIRLKGDNGLVNGRGAADTNVRGGDTILEGGRGAVGSAEKAIGVELTGTLAVRSAENIYITARAGDLKLESAFTGKDIFFTADRGSILDGIGNDNTKIAARNLTLKAAGAIGQAGPNASTPHVGADALEVKLTGTVRASATGTIALTETATDLRVVAITTTGDVILSAQASILDGGDLTSPRDIDSAPDLAGSGRANVSGRSIVLTAGDGIGSGTDAFEFDSNVGGTTTGRVTLSATRGNIVVVETDGDVHLASIAAADNRVAILTAATGSILNGSTDYNDSNGGSSNLVSGQAKLIASGSIGTATKRIIAKLKTATGDTYGGIEATAGNDVWLWNVGGLRVGGVTAGAKTGIQAGGAINVRTSSPVTIITNLISKKSINVFSGEDTTRGDDLLLVSSGVTIFSTEGSVTLAAGDDLTVEAGAVVKAKGDIVLKADFKVVKDADGNDTVVASNEAAAVLRLLGLFVGRTITIQGSSLGGTYLLDGTFMTGERTITVSGSNPNDPDEVIALDRISEGALTRRGSISLLAGDGNNTITFSDAITVSTGAMSITGGAGQDAVTLGGRHTLDSLTIDLAGGDNSLTATGTYMMTGALAIRTGAGRDVIDLQGSYTAGSMEIDAGDGQNDITLTGTYRSTNAFTIRSGSGNDVLRDFRMVGGVTSRADIAAGSLSINLGGGSNTLRLSGGYNLQAGAITITTGAGDDIVDLQEATRQNR